MECTLKLYRKCNVKDVLILSSDDVKESDFMLLCEEIAFISHDCQKLNDYYVAFCFDLNGFIGGTNISLNDFVGSFEYIPF